MKVCPSCKTVYKDEDINYCLADGTTLVVKKGKQAAHSHWNDVVALIVVAIAILVLLSLLSYVTDDPAGGYATGHGTKARNWIGPVGSYLSAFLLNFLGWTAYLFPLLIGLIAWRIFKANTLVPRALRVAGFIFFAVSIAGLIALFGGYGGIVGEAISQSIATLISSVGAAILLLAVFFSSLLLITNFTIAGFLGHFDIAWQNLKIRFAEWRKTMPAEDPSAVEAARVRSESRRKKREAEPQTIPPTVSVSAIEDAIDRSAAKENPTIAEPSIPTIEATPEEPPDLLPEDHYSTNIESAPATVTDFEPAPIGSKSKLKDDRHKAKASRIEDTDRVPGIVDPKPAEQQNFADYKLPDPSLLTPAPPALAHDRNSLMARSKLLETKVAEFNVPGQVKHISPGPVVTTYEFKPDAGVKYSRVTGLVDDLCLALEAPSIRIDRIPGKAHVGIEVPNQKRETIFLREVVDSDKFKEMDSPLKLALGKTIDGKPYVNDLAKMPHLLIAGATGAGKSVGVNTIVMSILFNARPDVVKFIMVDPKRLELGLYADIPHLSTPIITDPKRAATALRWAVSEMEKRYKELAGYGVRNIAGYNTKAEMLNKEGRLDDNGDPHRILPYIVIIIDELADLMMVSGKEVEESITRLAQMARAVGIHLILATQRPSVDVITGLIKANFPSRISFRVSSKVDSRTIIDGNGAESLLGQGDMLFLPPGNSNVVRVHGAFVNEDEIGKVVDFIKKQGRPEYDTSITRSEDESESASDLPGRSDALFFDALKCVVQAQKGSTSLLQRHLRIGYGRAAAILDAMVAEGYIGEMDGSTRARPILPKAVEHVQDLAEMENEQ